MRPCNEYAALLDLYVDGELPPQEMVRVQEHLDRCPGCRAYVDDALAIRAAFPDVEDTEVPEGFAESVCAVIQASDTAPKRNRRRRWAKTLIPMAACCAIVVLLSRLPAAIGDHQGAETAVTEAEESAAVRSKTAPASDDSALQNDETEDNPSESDTIAPASQDTVSAPQDQQPAADTAPKTNSMLTVSPQAESQGAEESAAPAAQNDVSTTADPGSSQTGESGTPEANTFTTAQSPAFFATLTLTPEQAGSALEALPADTPVSSDPETGGTVYWLTADQFDALLASLGNPTYTQNGEGSLARVILLPESTD